MFSVHVDNLKAENAVENSELFVGEVKELKAEWPDGTLTHSPPKKLQQ